MLNNEMTDFSSEGRNIIEGGRKPRRTALPPDNLSVGGKRPRSSMTPTIVMKDNKPYFLVGSPGGTSIPGTHPRSTVVAYQIRSGDGRHAQCIGMQSDD